MCERETETVCEGSVCLIGTQKDTDDRIRNEDDTRASDSVCLQERAPIPHTSHTHPTHMMSGECGSKALDEEAARSTVLQDTDMAAEGD